ncbi:MAG: hypothetical protein ACLRWQ_19660 [Flavonifractor plautii]
MTYAEQVATTGWCWYFAGKRMVELEENTVEVPGGHLDGRGRRRGRWGLHRPMGIINTPKKAARRIIAAYSIKMLVRDKTSG